MSSINLHLFYTHARLHCTYTGPIYCLQWLINLCIYLYRHWTDLLPTHNFSNECNRMHSKSMSRKHDVCIVFELTSLVVWRIASYCNVRVRFRAQNCSRKISIFPTLFYWHSHGNYPTRASLSLMTVSVRKRFSPCGFSNIQNSFQKVP